MALIIIVIITTTTITVSLLFAKLIICKSHGLKVQSTAACLIRLAKLSRSPYMLFCSLHIGQLAPSASIEWSNYADGGNSKVLVVLFYILYLPHRFYSSEHLHVSLNVSVDLDSAHHQSTLFTLFSPFPVESSKISVLVHVFARACVCSVEEYRQFLSL